MADLEVGKSKHIADEEKLRSLIGRPLVPYYADEGKENVNTDMKTTDVGPVTIAARKWNNEKGVYEPAKIISSAAPGSGAASSTENVDRKPAKSAAKGTPKEQSAPSKAGNNARDQAKVIQAGAVAADQDRKSQKNQAGKAQSSTTATTAFAWAHTAPSADDMPLPSFGSASTAAPVAPSPKRAASYAAAASKLTSAPPTDVPSMQTVFTTADIFGTTRAGLATTAPVPSTLASQQTAAGSLPSSASAVQASASLPPPSAPSAAHPTPPAQQVPGSVPTGHTGAMPAAAVSLSADTAESLLRILTVEPESRWAGAVASLKQIAGKQGAGRDELAQIDSMVAAAQGGPRQRDMVMRHLAMLVQQQKQQALLVQQQHQQALLMQQQNQQALLMQQQKQQALLRQQQSQQALLMHQQNQQALLRQAQMMHMMSSMTMQQGPRPLLAHMALPVVAAMQAGMPQQAASALASPPAVPLLQPPAQQMPPVLPSPPPAASTASVQPTSNEGRGKGPRKHGGGRGKKESPNTETTTAKAVGTLEGDAEELPAAAAVGRASRRPGTGNAQQQAHGDKQGEPEAVKVPRQGNKAAWGGKKPTREVQPLADVQAQEQVNAAAAPAAAVTTAPVTSQAPATRATDEAERAIPTSPPVKKLTARSFVPSSAMKKQVPVAPAV